MAKLKISGGVKYDVLNFNDDVFVDFGSSPILSGLTEPISFYLYLDTNNYSNYATVLYLSDATNVDTKNQLLVALKDNYLMVQCGINTSMGHQMIDITNFINRPIFVEIKRTDNIGGGADIEYIKIDGMSQFLTHSDITFGIYQQPLRIGTFYNPNNSSYVFKLYSATIWDLDIPGRNHWKGYTGNVDTGWLDQTGNNNGSVTGTVKTTRKISGKSQSKLSFGSGTSKLKIIPVVSVS